MLDDRYLILGLDGLSRAHGDDYFRNGHLAASVIAAYYLCRENDLDEHTHDVIKSIIDRELREDAIFIPAPDEAPDAALTEQLLVTLSSGVDQLREVGHNIIFGALALKAFRECPDAITPFRVDGITRLITDFTATENAGLEDDDGVPGIGDINAMIEFIFTEFLDSVSRYTGFGQGWTGHLLTIGQAVIDLSRLGHPDLAARARIAYRMYIKKIRKGPAATDRRFPDHPASALTPLDSEYWEQRKPVAPGLGHAFKYAYSFYNLLAGLNDPLLKERCLAESHKIF